MHKVKVEISARHVHLSPTDLEILFGAGYKLQPLHALSQPGQFAARETVDLLGPKHHLQEVRIIGPIRSQTQVELALTDGRKLGLDLAIRDSGDLEDSSGGVTLVGPRGQVNLLEGVIAAKRHLHLEPTLAEQWGLKNGAVICIEIGGSRSLIFQQVVVRSRDGQDRLSFQVDTDEANAAGLKGGEEGRVL